MKLAIVDRAVERMPAQRSRARSPGAERCRRKFLRYFPAGFADPTYIDWERGYKWSAHQRWVELLGEGILLQLLKKRQFREIASRAVRIESRTNLLFSFEKMAVRDAVRSDEGARAFAEGLYAFLHGHGRPNSRFEAWCAVVEALPRRQTRVMTWPVVTVFGFLAQPQVHLYLKPTVTRTAADKYGLDLDYTPRPSMEAYVRLMGFAGRIRDDLRTLAPRDMIDIQSFIWVLGSEEYPDH